MLDFKVGAYCIGALLITASSSWADDTKIPIGDATLTAKGAMTIGTAIRTDDPDPALYSSLNSKVIGLPSTAFGSNDRNNDDANLNYKKGQPVSSVVKGFVDLDLQWRNFGVFVRGKAWYDYTLSEQGVAWGNIPNGYVPGAPLSDNGLNPLAKFSGAAFSDAYVYGKFNPAGMKLEVKAGNLTIPWGISNSFGGGLLSINAIDIPATIRPGDLPEENLIPSPGIFTRLDFSNTRRVEAFFQAGFNPTELAPCGTFLSYSDILAQGCNKLPIGNVSDQTALVIGDYLARRPTIESKEGQFGLGFIQTIPAAKTEIGTYFALYNSKTPTPDFYKTSNVGAPFQLGSSKNPAYGTEYPEGIQVYGVNFTTTLEKWKIQGELTYRPNQPFILNIPDMLNPLIGGATTPLTSQILALAPGQMFQGYDRHELTQGALTFANELGPLLGGQAFWGGEIGFKYVNDLPPVTQRRYLRSDAYGLGPTNGACVAGAPAYQCSENGYVSQMSDGYRLNARLRYDNVLPTVAPNTVLNVGLVFGQDVSGWSYDYSFIQGRTFVTGFLRSEWRNYFLQAAYTKTFGGTYDFLVDRDVASLAVGAKF